MGNLFSNSMNWGTVWREPDTTPHYLEPTTFDPHEGFEYKRKERVQLYKDAEMEALRVDLDKRDFCAHLLIPFMACRLENYPFVYRCHHEKHAYTACELEDQAHRVKEWERERRMRLRQKRLGSVEAED